MSRYPMIPLGEILSAAQDEVVVEPLATYRIAGVYSFGRGLFARSAIRGEETSYPRLVRLHKHQFVVSRLKAFEGAVAVVDEPFDGMCLSPEFPTFGIDHSRADPQYVAWLCRWPEFWATLAGHSKGVGARRERVHTDQLLAIRVPMPSAAEQLQVVGRIQAIVRRVEEIERLQRDTLGRVWAVPTAMAHRADLNAEQKRRLAWRDFSLGEVLTPTADVHQVAPDTSYPNLGILSFGRGLFAKPPIEGASTSAKQLFRVRAGQFIYSRLFAFEGAYARVSPAFDGWFVSNEFPSFDCNRDLVLAEFLAAYFRASSVWSDASASSKGLGLRRQRVQPEHLMAHRLLIPPLPEQERIKAAFEAAERAEALLRQQGRRTKALVPSVLNRAFAGELRAAP